MYHKKILFLTIFILLFSVHSFSLTAPKYEFRGTWIHTVGQDKYAKMSEKEMKAYFISLLDSLQKAGINTVVFQVRPEADAWYKSPYEPWSRYITGTQGKDPGWDPLEFMVKECHKRSMDIHAWLNPYRVKASLQYELAPNHVYYKNPSWFVKYGNYLWFDPGNPNCRKFIIKVVKDIVNRYDIDAIHMDDYFYPYPVNGKTFDDNKTFAKYGKQQGFNKDQKSDWRRENVNTLIKELHEVIHKTKPWVRLGVSPFGIYQNQKNDPKGSKTNGLTNYDDLYADILLWINKGWIDYVIPQLYWEIGHRAADYETLINWWSLNCGSVPLYIGQDVLRTIKPDSLKKGQLWRKMQLAELNPSVSGYCFWPAYELERNAGGIIDSLKTSYFKYPALYPADNSYDKIPPKKVRDLKLKKSANNDRIITWNAPAARTENDKAKSYVVYGFYSIMDVKLEDPRNIVSIVSENRYTIPAENDFKIYVVTALDRSHNEGPSDFVIVK